MMQKFHRATILDTQLKGVVGIMVAVLTKNPSFTILLVLTYYSAELYCVILLAIVAIFGNFSNCQQLLVIVCNCQQLFAIVAMLEIILLLFVCFSCICVLVLHCCTCFSGLVAIVAVLSNLSTGRVHPSAQSQPNPLEVNHTII